MTINFLILILIYSFSAKLAETATVPGAAGKNGTAQGTDGATQPVPVWVITKYKHGHRSQIYWPTPHPPYVKI